MNRLRNRLILVFIAATLAPLALTLWVALTVLNMSLDSTRDLDRISQSLHTVSRDLYRRASARLREDAAAGLIQPQRFDAANRASWPPALQDFWGSGEPERSMLAGEHGEILEYLTRRDDQLWLFSAPLGVGLQDASTEYAHARLLVKRDLRRGFVYAFLAIAAAIWILAFFALAYCAHRISRPIQRLTTGLSEVAAGRLDYRVPPTRDDEIGTAIRAFNRMAGQLRESRDRLVYVTRLESWQALAHKMAHEVKNSLTPIRLTMEEIAARRSGRDEEFLQQASQIVVDEVMSLERRVRAFSEFAAEPPVCPKPIDVNALLEERIALLKSAHPGVVYSTRLADEHPRALADEDLVKGVLTNLLENAAQAAQPGGVVLGVTSAMNDKIAIEVHDSGPGLPPQARNTLFEPTISFKRGGMGLGLSIARKSALLLGGDIVLVPGELGGAAFRVLLPAA